MDNIQLIEIRGLKVYQNPKLQSFTLDSVLLEDFININRKSKNILEIGSGNGVISMLLSKRTSAKIDAVEILEDSHKMAEYNIKENKIENVLLYNEDILSFKKDEEQIYDIVFSNPPYFKLETNLTQMKDTYEKQIARNEKSLTLKQIVKVSKRLLKNNGHLYLVIRVNRLIEIINIVKENRMSVKRIKFIYTKKDKEAKLCLVEIIKTRSLEVHVLEPIFVYENNEKTEYIRRLFEK